jgi:hypothetical protein
VLMAEGRTPDTLFADLSLRELYALARSVVNESDGR